MKALEIVNNCIRIIENVVLSIGVAAMIFIVGAQVFCRRIHMPLQSGDELCRLFMLWITFIGAAAATRESQNIKLTMLTNHFPKRVMLFLDIIIYCLMIAFSVFLIRYGTYFAIQKGVLKMSTLPFSQFWLAIPIPVFAVLCIYHSIYNMIAMIKDSKNKDCTEGSVLE